MSLYTVFRNFIFALSRVSTPLALVLIVISFILSWTGFAVPDWLSFTTVNSYQRKFGLWNTCIQSITFFSNGYSCTLWSSSSEALPDFVKTTQGVITIGTIFVTFATGAGLVSVFLKFGLFRFLPVVASIFSLIAAIFIIIGLGVFGGDYTSYVSNVSGTSVARRWGYWVFVPVVIFLIFASLFFPFNFIYKNYISNRLYNFVGFNKGVTIPITRNMSRRDSIGNLEFAPRGGKSVENNNKNNDLKPSFKKKLTDRFSDMPSVYSLNLNSLSTENTSIASRSFVSFNKDKQNIAFDEDLDSRFNGRYLESVVNNIPYYTDDTVQISTVPKIQQQAVEGDDLGWTWQKR